MTRVVLLANKYWECDPIASALLNEMVRSPLLGWPAVINQPHQRGLGGTPAPRLSYSSASAMVELWCVSDFLEGSASNLQSSTEEKARVLASLFSGPAIDMLIALGTAGFPNARAMVNGSVAVGTHNLIHNGHPGGENALSNWTTGPFDTLIPSSLTDAEFVKLTQFDWNLALDSMVKVPNNPGTPVILAHHGLVAVGDVNVTDYKEYATKDAETMKAFATAKTGLTAASLETTHGLLRVLGPSRFMFMSGLTDRLGHFDEEVTIGQNMAASFNIGVVLSHVIPRLLG